ncbi:MAG: prepilin-type N-terminal cleavage/methylation domain-containing protein [Spirochaetales bacterium]|nr:prepilin-type N-terminal cleavage/methylation domain-containing protein [Spirochaetales bacterium]
MYTRRANKGITLIETMLAILLFSILSAVISAFLVTSFRNFSKAHTVIDRENSIILLEQNLSAQFSRVCQPFWIIPEKLETQTSPEGQILSVPWYDGIPDNLLIIAGTGNGITVSVPGISLQYKKITLETIEHIFDDDHNYIRLVAGTGTEQRELDFMFAGFGIAGE